MYLTEEARHKYGEFIKQVEGKSLYYLVLTIGLAGFTVKMNFTENIIAVIELNMNFGE